jgi:hypothetical protein
VTASEEVARRVVDLSAWIDAHPGRARASAVLGGAALAFANRFIQDDAFISFRYARHLAEGHGLVWNVGERVEGYTNFLWTVLMAVPHLLGFEPVAFSWALGLLLFSGTLWLVQRLAAELLRSEAAGIAVVALTGTNLSFSAYATGGLETALVSFLTVALLREAACGLDRNEWSTARCLRISLLSAACVLTRMDQALVVLVTGGAALLGLARLHERLLRRFARLTALASPFVAVVGTWLIWKWSFYGSILPNTFYVKATDPYLPFGIYYVAFFFLSYLLFPWPFLAAVALRRHPDRWVQGLTIPVGVAVLWLAYVIAIGGDFMEFRLLVPIVPSVMLLAVWTLRAMDGSRLLKAVLAASIVGGSLFHTVSFDALARGINSTRELERFVARPGFNWSMVGRRLGEDLPRDSGVLIAVSAAGAVSYYSRLPSIDMLGLSDAWIAHHVEPEGRGSGHRKRAPASYLVDRGVNLVVGHPWRLRALQAPRSRYSASDFAGHDEVRRIIDDPALPADVSMLEIPLSGGEGFAVLYVRAHPAVEQAIRERGWRRVSIDLRPALPRIPTRAGSAGTPSRRAT